MENTGMERHTQTKSIKAQIRNVNIQEKDQ